MQKLISKRIFHYLFWAVSFYIATYTVYNNFGDSSKIWDTVWFVNENLLIINILFILSHIIDEIRLKIFSYIAITFKIIICLLNILTLWEININELWAETLVSSYWIISLIFYLYVSRKRLC